MTNISLPIGATNSGTNDWSDVHGEDQAIVDVVNGNLTNSNLSGSAGITAANLASAVLNAGGITAGATTRRDYVEVLTEQTTTSTNWTDLGTVGPSVTVTVPTGGLALIFAQVEIKNSGSGVSYVALYEATDFAISGGVSAANGGILNDGGATSYGTYMTSAGETGGTARSAGLATGLTGGFIIPGVPTAGARTYTLKYGVTGGTGSFKNRKLWVTTLGDF